jgi:hypothetical protein
MCRGIFSAVKKYFCAVTFPKSIVRFNTAFMLVQPALAQKKFGASIREATDNQQHEKRVLAAENAALPWRLFSFCPRCVTDYALWQRVRPRSH